MFLELKAYSCDYGCKSEDRVVDSLTTSQRSISYTELVLIYRCKPANIVVSSLNTSQKSMSYTELILILPRARFHICMHGDYIKCKQKY